MLRRIVVAEHEQGVAAALRPVGRGVRGTDPLEDVGISPIEQIGIFDHDESYLGVSLVGTDLQPVHLGELDGCCDHRASAQGSLTTFGYKRGEPAGSYPFDAEDAPLGVEAIAP